MQRSIYRVLAVGALACLPLQASGQGVEIPRGAVLDAFVLSAPDGSSAQGRVKVAMPFDLDARTGTLSLEIPAGELQALAEQLHTGRMRGSAVGRYNAQEEYYSFELSDVVITSYQHSGTSARATLRVGRMARTAVSAPARTARAQPARVAARRAQPGAAAVRAPAGAEVDMGRVSTRTRQSYEAFWRGMNRSEASALERRLAGLEARAQRGENVDAEVRQVLQQHPQLARLNTQLAREPLSLANPGGGAARGTVECQGIGWIGMNGKLRCIGKLVVSS